MTRKGAAGRHPEKQIDGTESGIDKAVVFLIWREGGFLT